MSPAKSIRPAQIADSCDAAAPKAHIRDERCRPASVDHAAAGKDDVESVHSALHFVEA